MVLSVSLCRPPGPPPVPWRDDLETLRTTITAEGPSELQIVERDHADAIIVFHDDPARVPLNKVLTFLPQAVRQKAFVYSTVDDVFPFSPGFYPSLSRRNRIAGTRGCPYLSIMRSDWFDAVLAASPAKWLFSFAGNLANAPVREELGQIRDDRGCIMDTSAHPGNGYGQSSATYLAFRDMYVELIRDSTFVICPRGRGPASLRLYETMRAGRVPVILADEWVPPDGVAWDEFAVIVPERQVRHLGELLRKREPEAEALARRARAVWNENFGSTGISGWFRRQLESLLIERKSFPWSQRLLMLDPRNLRLLLRSWRHSWLMKKPFSMLNATNR